MRRAVGILATLLAGCIPRAHVAPALQPLADEGAVYVYLQPFPADAARLALSIASLGLARPDGTEVGLDLVLPEIAAPKEARQRLLASGRVPPGSYSALVLRLRRATLAGDEGPVDLLVPEEPVRVPLALELPNRRARVVRVELRRGQTVGHEFGSGAAFSASVLAPSQTAVPLAGYCSTTADAALVVFERRTKQVAAVIPTGREPHGIALDARAARAFVALAGEDQIEVLDLSSGEDLRRIALRPGDEPREVGLAQDGRLLFTVNRGSNSASFVDTDANVVVDRVQVGQEPWSLLLDRAGRRAYVLNRRSNDVAVVDLGNRAVVGRIPTDAEPVRAALNRAETRLYVIHRGSAYMNAFSLPDLAPAGRIFVGLGAAAIRVDPRTDRIYVGSADEGRIQVFDPASDLPAYTIDVPGPVSYLGIDELENELLAVMPSRRSVAFVGLTSRRVVSAIDVGPDPYHTAVVAERF